MNNIDIAVFHFFNKTCHNAILDNVMMFVTELGSGEFLVVLSIGMLFFRTKRVKMAGILILAGMTVSYNTVHFIKEFVARPRPFIALPDVNILFTTGGYSFPSNHATFAFLAAVVMSKYFKRWYLFFLAACLVVVSRVYLGVHFPSDVLAGAGIGAFLGYLLVYLVKHEENPSR